MRAREIIEAEDPKSVFHQATQSEYRKVERVLTRNSWYRHGSYWQHEGKFKPYSGVPVMTVWWDDPAKEWVLKREIRVKQGNSRSYKYLGHAAYKTADELLTAVSQYVPLYEAEDPKAFFAVLRARNPENLVRNAMNAVVSLPHDFNSTDSQVYPKINEIVRKLIADLEQSTGRRALDGTQGLFVASMPKPWNYEPGVKFTRRHVKELVSCFRNCSKPVKRVGS